MSDDELFRIRITRSEPRPERPKPPPTALDLLVYAKWAEFVEGLASRQATVAPDFNALYRRKSELDSKLHDQGDAS